MNNSRAPKFLQKSIVLCLKRFPKNALLESILFGFFAFIFVIMSI